MLFFRVFFFIISNDLYFFVLLLDYAGPIFHSDDLITFMMGFFDLTFQSFYGVSLGNCAISYKEKSFALGRSSLLALYLL